MPERPNPVGMAVVGGLHVAFIAALVLGVKMRIPSPTPPLLVAPFMPPSAAKPLPPLTVETPRWRPPTIDLQPPPVIADDPPPVDSSGEQPPAAAGSAEIRSLGPEAVIVNPSVDPRWPLTQPGYPPAAIRAGIEGKLAIEVLVGIDGRVLQARVARTSGFALLDQAALDEARHHWRLRPATRNGVPFAQWYQLNVVFRLEQYRH